MNFFRFIYIRYASGLIKEGAKLLHRLICLFIGFFSLQLVLIWISKPLFHDDWYLQTLKGRFCMKINLTHSTNSSLKDDQMELSLKPKLIIFSLCAVFWGLGQFYVSSAVKIRFNFIFKKM